MIITCVKNSSSNRHIEITASGTDNIPVSDIHPISAACTTNQLNRYL